MTTPDAQFTPSVDAALTVGATTSAAITKFFKDIPDSTLIVTKERTIVTPTRDGRAGLENLTSYQDS
jgi:hypothetical protein